MRRVSSFSVVCLLLACVVVGNVFAAEERVIILPDSKEAAGFISPGVRVGSLLYTAGQLPIDPKSGQLVEGIEAQTRQALENVQTVLQAGGSSLKQAVKINIYMRDLQQFSAMNAVYASFFDVAPPARTCIGVAAIPMDALIEIEAVGFVPAEK